MHRITVQALRFQNKIILNLCIVFLFGLTEMFSQGDSTKFSAVYEVGISHGFYLKKNGNWRNPTALKIDMGLTYFTSPKFASGGVLELQYKSIRNKATILLTGKTRFRFIGNKFDYLISPGIIFYSGSKKLKNLAGYSFELGQYNKKILGVFSSLELLRNVEDKNEILINLGVRTTNQGAAISTGFLLAISLAGFILIIT